MCNLCKLVRRTVRYWLFPETRLLDERTAELERQSQERKALNAATREIVHQANQPDVLRNLVIAMQGRK